MKIAILMGLTALVAIQAAAVPSAQPNTEASIAAPVEGQFSHLQARDPLNQKQARMYIRLLKWAKKMKKEKKARKKAKKAKKYKKKMRKYRKMRAKGQRMCGLPGTSCWGKRDVEELEGVEEGYCGAPGNPCNTVKRTAYAIADALEEARSVEDIGSFTGAPGTEGALAEEIIDEIASKAREAYSGVYEREAEAMIDAEEGATNGTCGGAGTPCVGSRDAKPDPEADIMVDDELGVCEAGSDTPCLTTREADAKKKKKKNKKKQRAHGQHLCGLPGTSCWLKREAEAEASADVEPPEADAETDLGFCGLPGAFCAEERDAAAQPKRAKGQHLCGLPGTSCWLKRDAEADAEAKRAKGQHLCGLPGTSCWGKREADAMAEADPEAKKKKKKQRAKGQHLCGLPGTSCWLKRDPEAEAAAVAEADAEAEAKKKHRAKGQHLCGLPGTSCWLKREAEAEADASAEAEAKRAKGQHLCGLPGTSCWGKREAEAEAEALAEADAMAEADPEAKKKKKQRAKGQHLCGLPGTSCWLKREAEAEADKRDAFCGLPGSFCAKPREAALMAKAIRKIDPEWLKNECRQNGHACNTIYNIHKAFHKAKQEAEEFKKIEDPMERFKFCSEKGADKCGYLTFAHQYAAKHNQPRAAEAEAECNADDGLCSVAKRDLDELESTIDAAVAAIEA